MISRNTILIILGFVCLNIMLPQSSFSQKEGPCPDLFLDLEKGQLNGLKPKSGMEKVKERLPCYTGETAEYSGFNCDGGVFFLDDDFFFYTAQNFIEVRDEFTGKISVDIMGKSMEEVKRIFGEPVIILLGESTINHLYKRKYGTLRFEYDHREQDLLELIGIHSDDPNKILLCQ